jgi:hypothetical protein
MTMLGSKGRMPLPKAINYDLAGWRPIYDMEGKNEIAEMIANGNDAILRVRDLTGALTERVLSGRNPLNIAVGGESLKILDISTTVAISYGGEVRVFLSAESSPRIQIGEAVIQALQPSFPNFLVSVSVQSRPAWFVSDGDYPFVNPFVVYERPPTPEEYREMKTLTCWHSARLPTCTLK